jgi:hypothetical protein
MSFSHHKRPKFKARSYCCRPTHICLTDYIHHTRIKHHVPASSRGRPNRPASGQNNTGHPRAQGRPTSHRNIRSRTEPTRRQCGLLWYICKDTLPSPLAVDLVGTVAKLGPNATGFDIGDKVFSFGNPLDPDCVGTQEYACVIAA